MGLKSSKQVPAEVDEKLNLVNIQNYLISSLAQSSYVRNLVSKQRRRLLVGGYDLDMSYITDHILAMSFPAEHMRAMYRNPLWQVKSVLDMRHYGHYKIYNLCIEESYDSSHFHGRVERFPFDDNHVPPLQLVKLFCESVYSWLSSDPNNVAVVHCMAGKGRTGLLVCCYLVYCGMSAEEALQLYAHKRTTNNQGVSIPSQRRYVGYWENVISFHNGPNCGPPQVNLPKPCSRELRRIRLYDVKTEAIFFVVLQLQEVPNQLYCPPMEVVRGCCRQIKEGCQRSSSPRYYYSFINIDEAGEIAESEQPRVVAQMDTESSIIYQKSFLDYYFDKPVLVSGDVRVIFYQKMNGGRLFYVCFNTDFIEKGMLQFMVKDLDKIGSKGKSICGQSFGLELLFSPANAKLPISPNDEDQIGPDMLVD
ncbi:Phosphatidylinositol 3,4,5-trisphosphate 3-phosphatase and protein-tyrosine-phosphatase pten1 [Ancistrocladus abbreviatus]